MDFTGYLASVLIGVSLGLVGGGGSILTVPVLVYLFKVDTVVATIYSLFIVGITSIAGAGAYFRKGWVDLRSVVVFGIPSLLAIFFTRWLIVPLIPNVIFDVGSFTVTKNFFLLLLFAVLMIFAAYSMIRKNKVAKEVHSEGKPKYFLVTSVQGLLVGVLTALIGAGGGFLIIPTLVNWRKLPMKSAIGTSLVIIAINSLAGFLFSFSDAPIRWQLLGGMTALAAVGIVAGSYLSSKIDGQKLKPAFGWFVLIMGLYIILKETLLK